METIKHDYYFIVGPGFWGCGETLSEAKKQFSKMGGRLSGPHYINRFVSNLPFAPRGREAGEGESDCWMSEGGFMRYIRCEVETTERNIEQE